jgi:exosortase
VSARPVMQAWLPAAILLGLFWLLIFNQQRLEWSVNVVYAYGWAVPFLSGYLIWERWRSRPAKSKILPQAGVIGLGILLLAAYLPLRVIQEANPDWVKINWTICALCSGLTLTAFAAVGGWTYVRHFFFPILFCFTALPWPVWMAEALVQGLMRMNAGICAELLTWGGMPAIAEGNLIQIAGHWLNVEEACSGIRSLQTAFMMSLFLGEFYRMGLVRRAVMMLSSFGVALFINVARTVVLAIFSSRGTEEKWHDTVGNIAMVVCLLALWLLSDFMGKSAPKAGTPANALEKEGPLPSPFPIWLVAVGSLWLIGSEVVNAAWYLSHEKQLAGNRTWTVNWPKTDPTYRQGVLGDRSLSLLKYNEGDIAAWSVGSDYHWQMYYLRWLPGRVSKFLSRSHYPTVCLPATGMKLVSEMGVWDCEIKGLHFPFSTYLFDEGGRDVYVFHTIMEDRPENPGERIVYRQVDSSERIDSVLHHERNLGQRVIGISLRGPVSPTEARETVASVMTKLITNESSLPLAQSTTP